MNDIKNQDKEQDNESINKYVYQDTSINTKNNKIIK
jgi:hypothetical protein